MEATFPPLVLCYDEMSVHADLVNFLLRIALTTSLTLHKTHIAN